MKKVCPLCVQQGKTSTIGRLYDFPVTLMAAHRHIDERGREHYHNRNRRATKGICSNGHEVLMVEGNKCRARGCEFGEEGSISAKTSGERPIDTAGVKE